jgi:amino acid adenylation domain-containing protein/non-ribosomal peptide synthase protein (TIGR01720 family)
MSLTDRLSALSPEQRALFETLREKQRQAAKAAARPPQPPPVRRIAGPAPEAIEGDWPLSLDQERFWFMEQLYPGHAGLNITAATRMRGPMSVPAMAAGLNEIVRRHAAWRTTFPVPRDVDGRPVQRVGPARPQTLALLDLSGLPEALREPEMLRLLAETTAAPFDLERETLVRSGLVRLGPRDHVCLLTVHHLVTDWISFQIAFGELAVLYGAFAAGRSAALPLPPVQYPDFAVWQREWLRGEVLDGLVSWWRERLEGLPLNLELPTDRPRPAVARMRGGRRVVGASRELSEALRNLGRREGATLFMTVLALVAALFHRLSGQEKLILGANNANRNRPELEPVLGCFLTQVPFPIDLAGDLPVRELLARVRQSALGSLAHQDLPFGKLVEALEPERDPSRQPVIQALVQVLDGQASKAAELAGMTFEPVDAHDGIARYDLFLTLFEYPDGLSGSLEYDADLFDATTAERLAELLFLQAGRAAADPDLRLSELPVLSEAQAQQALVEWNDTARPRPAATLTERFAAQAKRAPGATAVISRTETLTYGELDRRSDELAHRLRAAGVEPGSRVALLLGRTADIPVAILGCWKAGAAYVPLDPEWPAERLALVLEDAEPAAVVRTLDLDDPVPVSPQPLPAPDPDRLAYLIYTSGTTGRPKAVMVEHHSAAAMVGCILDLGVGPDDRVPHLSRYTFDVTLLEIVLPLAAGGICEIVDTEEVLDPEGFLSVLERSTRVFTLPALLRRAVEERGQRRFAGLRTLTSGGDLAPPDLLESMLEAFPSTDLRVLYGPTETTIICTGHRLSRARKPERALIGRPLANVEARVVDAGGRPVALGVPGELWIGGPGVARGYFRREELTAERFLEMDGRRFYRTGDLVRQVPGEGGELEFLGRIDTQVKIRGIRIEPGEIEAALRDHPAVRDAAVVAHSGMTAGGDKQLVAYVVGTDPADTAEALRAFLRERLPEAMIPSLFVPLPAMPVTSHGKVDRKALPAPQAAREAQVGTELPRNAREELLAGIWRELLGIERVERVGVHDNFFQLGGDSILSIQVVARARRAGLLITTRQFFDNQTIAGLAAVAESAEPSAADEGPIEGEAPLTPVQRRFFQEEPSRFNMAVMLAPRERLDTDRLSQALQRLARHHDALRLRFEEERQIHAPGAMVPLLEVDLGVGSLDDAAEQLQSGLDLARGPLFTAALFRRQDGDRLLLTAHHLIVDGVSWRVLLEDLAAAYRGQPLPPRTTSWKRWAERLNAFASEVTGELPYWLSLPSLQSLPSFPPTDPEAEPVELSTGATRALLKEAPDAYHTQVNDLLLAALARACGESTLLVDLEGHGREEIFPGVDLSRTVGWFTTTFPVALTLPPAAGPRESILAVKETLRAVPRRGLGYGLLRYVNPETSERLAALPEPQVSFNYLGQLDSAAGEGGSFDFAPEAPRGTQDDAKARLAVDCMVVDGRLRVICASERLARGFLAEVETLVAHCLSPEAGGFSPSDFPLARVDQPTLDRLLGADRNVEDLYPLAPLQEGILFHSAFGPHPPAPSPAPPPPSPGEGETYGVSGVRGRPSPGEGVLGRSGRGVGGEGLLDPYFQQLTAELEGPLDVERFAGAWQRVLDRHPALRTAFLWRKTERPLQLVRKHVELPWTVEELRGSWEDLLAADRARGFDLERAPLMRLTVVRTGAASHRLIWSSHHLIFDGWCLSILLSEVFALYQGGTLPPPPRPYRDYIAWLAQRDEAGAEGFWRERLRGFTEPTPLPFDHPSAQGEPFETSASLPPPLTIALNALAQRLQVTVNTLVQGAWALLLSRYAQVPDVLFGAVVSGRPAELPGVESMIGLFINTLPVRIGVPAEEPAAAWLARVQEAQLGLTQHQWTPLARIQSALAKLGPGEPLFDSLLVFENYPMAPSSSEGLGDLRVTGVSLDERTNYALTLIVVAREELTLRLVADRRFEPATARRILSHLERLLEGLASNAANAADTASPPLALPLLSEAERHQAIFEWNDTAVSFPREATIHGLFARQAALAPDAVAVEMGEERLTYAGLLDRATRIARNLVARGLRPEEPVAILAERSPDLIAALLGILQAGGAYMPLDPSHPAERLEWMVRDAGARRLEPGSEETGGLPDVPSGSLAYVMYTSGSTGTPKGVEVTHRNVIRLLWEADYADLGPDQVWLQCSPVAFDLSTLEVWAPLLHGGRLVLFPGRMGSLDELARVIERHGVTSAWLTAGLFHEMVDGRVEGLRPLRQLLAGGDVVSVDHARRALEAHPGLVLVDGYGPTENTTFTTCHRMTAPPAGDTVPIGRPIVNTRAYVLDGDLRPVPVGVRGELYAGGEGVARGYLGRPDLTAERFVPDPYGTGSRLYRTGDVVRRHGDGVLEFLGRRDDQVKIRGFRVEPAEVEAELLACPGVRRAAVVVAGEAGDRSLRAFWVGEADADELRTRLRARLPEAMVPSVFAPLPDLPLTPNGKVDRRALAAMKIDAARRAGEHVAPRTALEERLAEIWSRVLEVPKVPRVPKVETVGVFDNFFDLGGHSLLATQLVTRIRDVFGVELPVSFVFQAPTLAAQAAGVAGARPGATPAPILSVSGEGALPVSYAQERIWFLHRFDPASPAYNMPLAIRLSGALDVAALERAFEGVVRRHETLRTTFHDLPDGGGPVQRVSPAPRWTLPVADLSGVPDPRAEAERLGLEDALAPFDLARGPVLRTRLLRLAPREHILQLCIHHIAADLWAMNILIAEVAALYEGRELPPLPFQYSGFAAWQREWLQGGELERQVDFWRRELAGAPPMLDLPTDRPRPQILSYRGSSRPFEPGVELSDAVARLARDREATPFMVLLAALGAVASRWSGQDDLVLGTPIANRPRPELEGLVGLFVNSLPMRVRLEGRPSFADLLARVRSAALAAYEHQDVPFEKLVEELRPPRSLSRHPLFQAVLALQNVRQERIELPGVVLDLLEAEHKVTKFDLTLTLFEGRDGFVGNLEWATDLFDAATVERFGGHLKTLLAAAMSPAVSPETPAAELPMLTGAESRQLLVDWNDTAVPFPREATIHGLFLEQAARTPDAVAVEMGDERLTRLTYTELRARAERIARRLVAGGLRPETRVSVAAERSPDLIAALLGILQAGGVYVPIDPAYPPERQEWMVRDAGAVRLALEGGESGAEFIATLPEIPAGALAHVLYTSGSTGTPKGVGVTHRNVVRLARAVAGELGPDQTWLQYGPLSFDASTLEIWTPLLSGGRVVLFPGRMGSLDELARVIERHGVTAAWLTAGLFHEMVDGRLDGLRPLRHLLTGGDVVSPDHARRALEAHPGLTLIDGYGPTENTVFTSWHLLTGPDHVEDPLPIGRPLANTRVYVLSDDLQPVPVGVWGELCAGGEGLSRGYMGRPDLTAERFVPDGFSGSGERLYRTGDRVRWRPDRTLEFQGRLDSQVKIRGFRIEPGEVEAALLAAPGVQRGAVVVVDKSLRAFWVGEAAADELRASLRARLPEALVPSVFIPLPDLPLTPNGKVDRRALAALQVAQAPSKDRVAPRTPLEETLVEAAAEVLERRLEEVGVLDNFFDLGGHSLLATRFVSLLSLRHGIGMPLQLVFETANLAELADRIMESELSGADDEMLASLLAEMEIRDE